jgi:hypothetical protein
MISHLLSELERDDAMRTWLEGKKSRDLVKALKRSVMSAAQPPFVLSTVASSDFHTPIWIERVLVSLSDKVALFMAPSHDPQKDSRDQLVILISVQY